MVRRGGGGGKLRTASQGVGQPGQLWVHGVGVGVGAGVGRGRGVDGAAAVIVSLEDRGVAVVAAVAVGVDDDLGGGIPGWRRRRRRC